MYDGTILIRRFLSPLKCGYLHGKHSQENCLQFISFLALGRLTKGWKDVGKACVCGDWANHITDSCLTG